VKPDGKPGTGDQVLHWEGKTVIPGLVNAHGHVGITDGTSTGAQNYNTANIERQLKTYERYGVTTTMSLGLNRDLIYELRDKQRAGQLGGATILTAGRGIGVPGGVPGLPVGADQLYRPRTPDEGRQAVREMAAHRPDVIKIWVDDNLGKSPKPDFNVETAVIDEAHRQHLKVAAHVFYLADAKKLVAQGVDILAHSIRDKPVDADLIQQMKAHGTSYIPTLQLEEAFFIYADRPDWIKSAFFLNALQPETREFLVSPALASKIHNDPATVQHREFLQIAERNVKTLKDAGIPIGFGTDSGAMSTRVAGFAEHRELQLMVEAGLSPADALRSATAINAQILGIPNSIGTIEPGKNADLIVLNADPLQSIANTEQIAAVFHNGQEIKLQPAALRTGVRHRKVK
jgi:imidazolonepropionase-like amidohydrolase